VAILQLNNLLDAISSNEGTFQQTIALILQKENYKHALSEVLAMEIPKSAR
jgi:hypothetical protein